MREILFKAKHKGTGKWIEGFYCSLQETTYCFKEDYERFPVQTHHYIVQDTMTDWGLPNKFSFYEIDPSTLCQFTGLIDKNCKKIFENDIVGLHSEYQEKYYCGQVKYGEFNCSCCDGVYGWYFDNEDIRYYKNYEVIGNVFDNPELLTERTMAEI